MAVNLEQFEALRPSVRRALNLDNKQEKPAIEQQPIQKIENEVSKSDTISSARLTYNSVKGFVSNIYDAAKNKYFKPLSTLSKSSDFSIPQFASENLKSTTKETMPDLIKGTYSGLVKGVTLGLIDPTKKEDGVAEKVGDVLKKVPLSPVANLAGLLLTTKTGELGELGKQQEMATEFISYMIPYEAAEKVAAFGMLKAAPSFIVKHPRIAKALINIGSFVGTTQLSKEAFTLTEEEKSQGLTPLTKRAEIAAADLSLLGLFKMFGVGFNLTKGKFISDASMAMEKQLSERAAIELKSRIPKIESGEATTREIVEAKKINDLIPASDSTQVKDEISKNKTIIESKLENAKESGEYLKEKVIQGTQSDHSNLIQSIDSVDDIAVEAFSDVVNNPSVIVSEKFLKNNASVIETIDPAIVARSVEQGKSIDAERMLKDFGYKNFVDFETKVATEISSVSPEEIDMIIGGSTDLSKIGQKVLSDEAISFEQNRDDILRSKIKEMVSSYLIKDTDPTGFIRGERGTIEQKSMIKRMLSYLESDSSKLSKAYETVEKMSSANELERTIDYTIDSLSEKILKAFDSGKNYVVGASTDAGLLEKIILSFKKTNGTYNDLAESILSVFGRKKTGVSSFPTANKLISQLGFSDVKQFAETLQKTTGVLFFDESGKTLSTYNEAVKALDSIAKKEGKTNALELVKSWELEKLDRKDIDKIFAVNQAKKAVSDDFSSLEMVNTLNHIEVEKNLREFKEGGYIALNVPKNTQVLPPEVEAMYSQKTSVSKSIMDRLKKFTDDASSVLKTLFAEPETNPEIANKYPLFTLEKYKIYGLVRDSSEYGSNVVNGIISDLKPEQYDSFRKIITLSDLLITKGGGKEVPRYFTDVELVESLNSLRVAMQQDSAIRDAVLRHMNVIRAIRSDMEKNGWEMVNFSSDILKPKKDELESFFREYFNIPNLAIEDIYFPHKVTDYTKTSWLGKRFAPKYMKESFKPYTIKRGGSAKDIVLDYDLVMHDYISSVTFNDLYDKRTKALFQRYDVMNKVDDSTRQYLQSMEKVGRIVNTDVLPESVLKDFPSDKFEFVQYERGNRMFPALTTNEKALEYATEVGLQPIEMLDEAGPKGGALIREQLVLGKKRGVYLVPKEIAEGLRDFQSRVDYKLRKIFSALGPWMPHWKTFVTKWYGGVNWRLANTIGDFTSLAIKQPQAYTKVLKATSIAFDAVYRNKNNINQATIDFIKQLKDERVLGSTFFRGEEMASVYTNPFNILKPISEAIDNASAFMELVPKISSILSNLKRVEEGKLPILTGADTYIKSLVQQGYVKEAVFSFGRGLTGDYAAIPPMFRAFATDGLMPFSFWFMRNTASMFRAAKDNYKIPLIYGAFLAACEVWNNTGDREKYERGLKDYERYVPHIWVGEMGDGKVLKLNLGNPFNEMLRFFGGDRLTSTITSLVKGETGVKEAAATIIGNTIMGPPRFIESLLSPTIKTLDGILRNKDPLTGREIVPKEIEGTDVGSVEALKLRAMFFAENMFTPFQQVMITYSKIDPSTNVDDFLVDILSKPFRQPVGKLYDETGLMLTGAQNVDKELEAKKELFLDSLLKSVLDKDSDKFNELMTQIGSNEAPTTIEGVNDFFKRPSTLKSLLKYTQTQMKTEKDRDKIRSLLNMYNIIQTIKSAPKEIRGDIIESLQ